MGGGEYMAMSDITGKTFGMIEVLEKATSTQEKTSRWKCRCLLCGKEVELSRKSLLYRRGKRIGCGCESSRKQRMPTQRVYEKKGGDTLCWKCSLAGKSICEWDRELKPVPGWEAEETKLWMSGRDKYETSYRVISCPKKQ